MNEDKWIKLIENAVFLSPAVVEGFFSYFGDAIVMPLTFRGRDVDYEVSHSSGSPVFYNGKWYSLWGMRPSRDVFSVALGLKRRDLERDSKRPIKCMNGRIIKGNWRVHHIYECGLLRSPIQEKADRFTNLANLVLINKDFHEKEKCFVHGNSLGADWLKWVVCELYPKSSKKLGIAISKPIGSPDLNSINIAYGDNESFKYLKELRDKEPAGSNIATKRIEIAMLDGSLIDDQRTIKALKNPIKNNPNNKSPTTVTASMVQRRDVIKKLKSLGYIARQNKNDVTLYLNLGGKRSEINKDNFKGLVLLNPFRKIAFGAGAAELIEFRKLVMKNNGNNEWVRINQGVPGPPKEPNRVEVSFSFDLSCQVEPRIACNVGKEQIWIDGYADKLNYQEAGYAWDDIEFFLDKLSAFSLQPDEV